MENNVVLILSSQSSSWKLWFSVLSDSLDVELKKFYVSTRLQSPLDKILLENVLSINNEPLTTIGQLPRDGQPNWVLEGLGGLETEKT